MIIEPSTIPLEVTEPWSWLLGVDVNLIGWVGVGLGGTYDCRCGILYASMSGVVFYAGLVNLTSSSPKNKEKTEKDKKKMSD